MADIFDRDGDGYIDYYEFVAALHPNKDAYKPLTDADKIEDEVMQTVMAGGVQYLLIQRNSSVIHTVYVAGYPSSCKMQMSKKIPSRADWSK